MIQWALQVVPVVKNLPANAGDIRDVGSIPRSVRKIPWRRAWQFIPICLPEESHGQSNLVEYCSCGCKESGRTEAI